MKWIRKTEISQFYGYSIPLSSLHWYEKAEKYIHNKIRGKGEEEEEVIYDKCKYIKLEHKNLFFRLFFFVIQKVQYKE